MAVAEGDDAIERLIARARAAAARAAEVQAHTAALHEELEDTAASRTRRRCAWCGRTEVGGRWRTEQDLPEHVKARRDPDSITPGICEDCLEQLRASGRIR